MKRLAEATVAAGVAAVTVAAALLLPACAHKDAEPTTRPLTAQERQDRALHDPFGYKPDWTGATVTGGGTTDLDKDGLKKDLKNVLDP